MALTLNILENEKVFIPKKFYKVNDLCAIIYDQLTEIYKEKNYKPLLKTSVKFKDSHIDIDKLESGELHMLDWLKKNELNEEIELVLTKHILLAVVSDFINFIFESMHCAKRGKMTVAYALLRKPFNDELLILEQLLTDRKNFIIKFFHIGDPDGYDPSDKKLDKKRIISESINKIRANQFLSPDLIYDLRYNKAFEAGINGYTNQALHIVTKDRNYKTTEQNFNFVFSQKEDMQSYFNNYYFVVPHLLIYAVSVIDEIIFSLLTDKDNQAIRTIKEFRRMIGFILFTEYTKVTNKTKNKKIFKSISEVLEIECPECKHKNNLDRDDCILFFETEIFICVKCYSNLLTTMKSVEIIGKVFNP